MNEWVALLQSLVWPLFMAVVVVVWLWVRAKMKLTGQAEIPFPVIGTVKVHDIHALILLGFVLLAAGQLIPGLNSTLGSVNK